MYLCWDIIRERCLFGLWCFKSSKTEQSSEKQFLIMNDSSDWWPRKAVAHRQSTSLFRQYCNLLLVEENRWLHCYIYRWYGTFDNQRHCLMPSKSMKEVSIPLSAFMEDSNLNFYGKDVKSYWLARCEGELVRQYSNVSSHWRRRQTEWERRAGAPLASYQIPRGATAQP